MADATIAEVHAALLAAIAVDHGGGLDLSPTGAVLTGRYADPPRVPFASLGVPQVTSSPGPLALLTYRGSSDLLVWAPYAGEDLVARLAAAMAAQLALHVAINTARRSPSSALYTLRTLEVTSSSLDAAADAHPIGAALVALTVAYEWGRSL